ncbi:MAG: hypothetical protein K6E87_00865 [bacterium]|nr:hypothetical protein [bacterium]
MKKTISGVLLALTAAFAIVGCGKKKSKGTINFYCWNDEFKTRLNKLYPDVEKAEGSKTTLKNGVVINWVQSANQSAVYQGALDTGLENEMVDMFCFEADYATKYVKSDYVADMGALGIDQSKQYKYTKDIVTNASGKLVGSSWQATPGIIAYNNKVAKAAFGDNADMGAKLNTWDAYKTTAGELKAKGFKEGSTTEYKYYMNIGTDDWFRVYQNNLSAKMYNGSEITIDKQLYQWIIDTKQFVDDNYIKSTADTYGLWGEDWGKAQGGEQCLCVFSCPWFTDFCLNGNAKPDANGDLGYRAVKGYASWFWGGTWLTATKKAVENEEIKDTVKDIIAKMTTDTQILTDLAKEYGDFCNDEAAMNALAASADGNSKLFGGQNVFKIYAESVKSADLSKASDFDQQICENIQNAFRPYFQGTKTATAAQAAYVKALGEATSLRYEDDSKDSTKKAQIKVDSKVQITDAGITINA